MANLCFSKMTPQNLLLLLITLQSIGAQIINNEHFSSHQGLYYQHEGQARISNVDWDLVAYVDLQVQSIEHQQLMYQYHATLQICNDTNHSFELTSVCKLFIPQFNLATLPYLFEIESNYRSLMLAIGYKPNERTRRGLTHTVKRLINVLYGVCSKLDVGFIVDKIIELGQRKLDGLNLVSEHTRIAKVQSTEGNLAVKRIAEHQSKLKGNLKYLQNQMEGEIQNIDKVTFRTKLMEQGFLFEMLLNKYAFETQNLISIVNAALDGKIHTSVLSTENLLSELREIKMTIPVNHILPTEINTESLAEFLRISEISIFITENHLVFVISIPLVTFEEYTVYHPIPLPIGYGLNAFVLIAPQTEHLAVSRNKETYFTLTTEQWKACTEMKQSKLCKGSHPIYHQLGSHLCEVSLLTNNQKLPEQCNLKLVTVNKPIWHRLPQTNSWLYSTRVDAGNLICLDPTENSRFEVSGVGRLTIPSTCEIHVDYTIFTPIHKNVQNIRLDLIPEDFKNKSTEWLAETFKNIIPQNLSYLKSIDNLNDLAFKAVPIDRLFLEHTEHKSGQGESTIYIILFALGMSFGLVIIISIKCKKIKMYKPEIPDSLKYENTII